MIGYIVEASAGTREEGVRARAQGEGEMSENYERHYDSVTSLLDKVARESDPKGSSRTHHPSESWDFCAGYEGAMRLARNGWPDGAAKIKMIADQMKNLARPDTHQQDYRYCDDGGAYVDVARFCEGDPEHFVSFCPPQHPRKTIRMGVFVGHCCAISGSSVMHRGAAIAAAIDQMEERHYDVELYGCNWCSAERAYSGALYEQIVKIKDSGQHLDLERVAYLLAHPSFTRRILFGEQECNPPALRSAYGFTARGCYGYYGCDVYERTQELFDVYVNEGGYRQGGYGSASEAVKTVKGILKTAGIMVDEPEDDQ